MHEGFDGTVANSEAFWDEPSAAEEARKRRITWRRENQMTPITEEQAKDLRGGEDYFTSPLTESNTLYGSYDDWKALVSRGLVYWSRKAAEAALAKTTSTEETPEQRDARIKALVDGYKEKGGPITREQLANGVEGFLWDRKQPTYIIHEGEVTKTTWPGFYNIDRGRAFWNKPDAEHEKLLEDGKTQMTPITPDQAKLLRDGDEIYIVQYGQIFPCLLSMVSSPLTVAIDALAALRKGQAFFTNKAAQAALDKQKAVSANPEHKFPEIPSWCPPLPEGYIPLGFGETFKTDGKLQDEICAFRESWIMTRQSVRWDCSRRFGTHCETFYIAPSTSEIAKMNYPWLAGEKSKQPGTVSDFVRRACEAQDYVNERLYGKTEESLVPEPTNTTDKWIERKKGELIITGDQWTQKQDADVQERPIGAYLDGEDCEHGWIYYDRMKWTLRAGENGFRARYLNPNYKEPEKPVESHETSIRETQAPLSSTDETKRSFSTGAVRDSDDGKPRMDLIAPEAMIALGRVLANGTKHYGERNWERGIPLSQFLASMMRHYVAVQMGDHSENHDEKMLWNAMAFVATAVRIKAGKLPVELDDIGWTKEDK
jgi:hypothetical protein